MSKIFEGLDKAASRQIQNIVRQNPKGSADEKMLLKRYIMTPMVQDMNLDGQDWINQASKWLAGNKQKLAQQYPDLDLSDVEALASKMYEDFLAMQGHLEEARWKGKVLGGLAGGPLGMLAADQIEKYMNDPEYAAKVNKKFSDLSNAVQGKTAQPTAQPDISKTVEKPRARINPKTGELEPVKTDAPKTTKPKTTKAPKTTTTPVEPPQSLGQMIGKKGFEPDVRTWRNVKDKASDVAKVAGKTPIGRKIGALGAAAGVVGGIGSQMHAGIENRFKDLIGKDADKPKSDVKPTVIPPKTQPAQTSAPPASSTTSEPETDILGAPGTDVLEPNGPIDRDRSTDVIIPQRPKKIEYDQPEMPFENTDAVALPQSSGGIKKVAKTIGKGILPGATALTVGDDYKDLQQRLGKKDYAGAALRGVATTTGLIPHYGSQAVSLGAEGALAAYDNPKVVKDFLKNYKPVTAIGQGIKEGYSAGAVGGTGLGEGDAPPKVRFNPKPKKKGEGNSPDDYEYTDYVPRGKEDSEAWAIKRTVANQKLPKKKPKELDTGFYKNYLGNRPVREEELEEASPNQQLALYNPSGTTYRGEYMPKMEPDPVDKAKPLSRAKNVPADLPDVDDEIRQKQLRKKLLDIIDNDPSFTPRHRYLIKAYYLDGKTFDQLAKELDVSSSRVNQLVKKAERFLRHPERAKQLRPFLLADGQIYSVDVAEEQAPMFTPEESLHEYDANLIKSIAASNQIKNPDLIYPGQKITLPSGDTHVVKKGDTLGDIVYNRSKPVATEPVTAEPKIEVPKEVPVDIPKSEPRISNRYPDSGLPPDSKFVDVRNNPGNLRGTDALRKPGYVLDKAVGFDKNGFAIFNNPEDGKEAMRRQLALDALKRGLTGRQLINKYAPPSDNNDTDAYIKNTFGELGLDPDSKISPEDLDRIQKLMVRQEHGKEGMNFYYPKRQMVAKVNEMEILQRFLDKNIEKGAQKLGQQEKEKAAKERPVPNPNAEYQGPKSAAYDISLRKQSVDPVDVAIAALPKDIEDAKKLKQQSQAPKESSILKGIKGHKS
jgi:RNA polymerase sigma factor (sigma-70 family)